MILIDMEMPNSCRECWFLRYETYIGETSCVIEDMPLARHYKELDFEGRYKECPLIEVPDTYAVPYAFAKAHECCGGCTEITDIVMKRYNAIRKVAGMDEIEEIKEPEGE